MNRGKGSLIVFRISSAISHQKKVNEVKVVQNVMKLF